MQTSKGTTYEHNLAGFVSDQSGDELIPLASGYNSALSQDVDMLIDDGELVHVFEVKRTSQDAFTLYWDEDEQQTDDLYGLCKFCVDYPRHCAPYAAVRFDRNRIVIARLYINEWPDRDAVLDSATMLCETECSVTRAGNLRFYKPGSAWPGTNLDVEDGQYVLDRIGYQ